MKRKDEANFQPIRSTTQIWVVTRHQYGISALVSQTSFSGKNSGGVAKLSAVFSGYEMKRGNSWKAIPGSKKTGVGVLITNSHVQNNPMAAKRFSLGIKSIRWLIQTFYSCGMKNFLHSKLVCSASRTIVFIWKAVEAEGIQRWVRLFIECTCSDFPVS